MTKQQAHNIAKAMYSAGISAYAGKYRIASVIQAPVLAITDTMVSKVMVEFLTMVVNGTKHPVIEKLFAQEELANGHHIRR